MASNNEDIKWLYDKLKAKGYNIGSEDEFTNSLANEEDRQWYYDKATGMGLNMGSIDDFNELYAPKMESKTKESPATSTVHTQQQTPKVSAPLAEGVRLPNAGIQRALGQQSTIEDMPQPQAQPQVGEFARQQVEQFNKAVNANRAEMFKQPALRDEIGGIKAEQYNPDAVAAMERAYTSFEPKTFEEQIADIEKRIDQRQKELYNERNKQQPVNSFVFGAGAAPSVPKVNTNEDDEELQTLIAARDQLYEAKKAKDLGDADVADNKAGNTGLWGFFKGASRGFASSVFDLTTWDFGVSDLSNNTQLLEVAQKAERGDKLTQAEEDLLTAASINAAAQSYLSEVGGYGTTAGKITGESLPFMLEFAINPLSGSSSSIAKYGAKKFGVTALKKGIGKKLAKAGLRTAGDVAAAAGMTATTGATRVAADATQRMTGNIMPTYDEFGYIQYGGREGAEDNVASAVGKAAGSNIIENYSELLGAQFAPMLNAGGKFAKDAAEKVGLKKATEIISDISGSNFAKGFRGFLDKTQWHGPVGEYFEEVASNILNAAFVGDMKFDASEEGVFNLENNIDTFLGVALMGGAFSAINTVGYAVEKADNMRVNRQLKNQSVRMSEMLGDKWTGIKDQIDSAEDEQLKALLAEITVSSDYTDEQKQGIWQYAAKLKASQGANMVRLEQQIGGEFSPELNDVMESYDAGYKAQLSEAAAIKAAYDDAVSAYEQKYEPIGDDINYAITEAINVGDTERRDALVDVAKKRAAYEGIKQQARDNAEDRIAASNMRIDRLSNQGNIISATLKDGDKPIYITSGNVQVNSDNTLNISDSSSFMVAQTPEGEIITVSPDQILRIDAISPASEQKYLIEQMIWQEEAQNIANVENGSVSVQPGETYTVINDYGEPIYIQVIRDNMDGTYLINDGMQNVNMNAGQLQQMLQQSMVVNARTLREEQEAQRQQQNAAAAVESAPVEAVEPAQEPQPIMVGDEFTNAAGETGIVQSVDNDGTVITWERADGSNYTNRMTAEDIAAMQAQPEGMVETQPAETPAVAEAAAPSPEELQTTEQAQTTVAQTPESVIAEMQDFEPEEKQTIINNNIQAAEQAYNDILSAKPVPGMDIAAFRSEKAEWQANVEQAKANLDFWNNVNALLIASVAKEAVATPEETQPEAPVSATAEAIAQAEAETNTEPTEAQKEAGNYKKGHVVIDGMNITIEQPKGSVRRGTEANGKAWETVMQNTYGYIRGTQSVDGDHIDIFLSDNPETGNVYVVDQVNNDGSFDEHKVMYGFNSVEEARAAYLSNYEEGWQGLGNITEVSKEDFKKWLDSSTRKTKPFAEYASTPEPAILDNDTEGAPQDVAEEAAQADTGVSQVDVSGLMQGITETGYAKLSDYATPVKPKKATAKKAKTEQPQKRLVSDERYAELRERMRKKLGQLNVGIDPEIIGIGAEMAVYHLENGAIKFADYARNMIADLGDAIRPFLKSLYSAARDYPGVEGTELGNNMTPYDEVRNIDVNSITLNEEENERETTEDAGSVIAEGETVLGETASIGADSTEAEVNEAIAKIEQIEAKANEALALLGYYDTEGATDKDFNEAYGYLRAAEKKFKKDLTELSKRLAKDLGLEHITQKGKNVYASTNIAPAGGDGSIILKVPGTNRVLYINIHVEPNYKGDYEALTLSNEPYGLGSQIMYRMEDEGYKNFGSNNWANNKPYDELLKDFKRLVRWEFKDHVFPEATVEKPKTEKKTRRIPKKKENQSVLDYAEEVAETLKSEEKDVPLEGKDNSEESSETSSFEISVPEDTRRAFSMAVTADMLEALENNTKPYKSITDLRKRALSLGMEVDTEGRSDILLQELVEDGLVRAARSVIEKYGASGKETYDKIVQLYDMQPTIAARSANRIKMQQYSTPLPMAWIADTFALYGQPDAKVLEPTAGNGMLVFAVPSNQVHVNELDETRLSNLREQGFAEVTQQDAVEPFNTGKIYDAVISNPPFGQRKAVEYDGKMISGLDPQIALNALDSMKDSGRAAIIIGGNMEYAKNGSIKGMKPFFTYLYDHYNVKGVIDMSGKLFAKQGTTFPTRMILIEGRRSEEDRAQTAVYPPVLTSALPKAETFEELYDILEQVLNTKSKTNGTEVLRSQNRKPVSDVDRTSGDVDRAGRSEQPDTNDGTGRSGEGQQSDILADTEGSKQILPGEYRKDSGDGKTEREADTDRTGDSTGNIQSPVQRVGNDGVSENRAGLKQGTNNKEKRSLTEEKLPYIPHNTAFSLKSVAPAAMVEAMDKVLTNIEEQYGNIDEFVRSELGYSTIEELHQALAAEQLDSVAMAIYQMKKGQALIIGDQTGVGKGRQMAALIRWAVNRGEKPVFITQKADLFSDIYRDLVDIGSGDLKPFIFNSDGAMVDSNGNVVHKPLSQSAMAKVFQTGKLPEEYDFAVLTYSQVNTGDAISRKELEEAAKKSGSRYKKKEFTKATPKATFLRSIAKDNYLFLDESHTAAGSSNTGAYLQSILRDAKAVTFASATFAKRPDTMPLYAIRTAMSQAKVEADKLISIIERGGVTLQEIMSRELTNAGQMVRRERDMSDVVTDWKTITDPEIVRRARDNYDKTILAFNAIIKFQEEYVKPKINELDSELAIIAESAGVKKGTDKMGVENVPFASKTYNYTKQLMLALKVDAIAEEVEKEISAGRHPVIALESTMESSIKDYAPGEVIEEPTFSASLLRGLDSVMQYTIKDENGKETHAYYTPAQLGPSGEKAYYELQKLIRESTSDIFISPLDAIISKLKEKGYRVGELTGRNLYVEINDEGQAVVKRRTDKDKKKMQRDFNSGELDVLILNKSASTGISLHASEKFSDQRQRTMIIAQPLSDINDYMQMIGRIDRTGQVHRGYYINLGLPVPAENRFLMMLSTKLKSLNANTTTSQDSESSDVEAPDLLNKYGSQVVVEYLRDNPEAYEKMGMPLKKAGGTGRVQTNELEDYVAQEDDARKVTGYVALLPTKEQEDFYDDVVRRYNELIKYLNDTGNNDLKITVMPLRAKTLSRKVSSEGIDPEGSNPFARNSYVENVEMDVLRKPMTSQDIQKTIEQVNKGLSPEEYKQNVVETIDRETEEKISAENERYQKAKERALIDIEKQTEKINRQTKRTDEEKQEAISRFIEETNEQVETKHNENIVRLQSGADFLKRKLNSFEVGKSYLVPDNLESLVFDFASPAIFCGYKTKDKKITPSTTLAVFATLDGRRRVEVKLSQTVPLQNIMTMTNNNWDAARSTTLENWDTQIPKETRKEGYIMTGNILQAIADTQDELGGYPGQLISYTDIDGNIHDGILMPDKWKVSMLKTSGAPIMSRIEQIKNFKTVTSLDGKVVVSGSRWSGMYYLTVPKTKKDGAIYYQNETLLDAAGGDFYPYSGRLRADIYPEKIDDVVKELTKLGVRVKDNTDELQREGDGAYTDAEVSMANDPISKVLGRNHFSKRKQAEFAERERERMVGRVNELAKKLNLTNVDVVTDASTLSGPQSRAKGFYNTRTGRITVVIPNHVSSIDVEQTLLHEAVAHYGLRRIFGKDFDTFLDSVYEAATPELRQRIDALVEKYGDKRTATEEYIASLAESTDFENFDYGWWSKVKENFVKMLNKLGFNFEPGDISDNELRYLLWRSNKSLREPGAYNIRNMAEDVAMQSTLQVGNYAPSAEIENEVADVRYRTFGGNSGYVGYSMSKRAQSARGEGRFPKTDFMKEYNIPAKTLKTLVDVGIINDNEWHHTSKFGNETTFYGWDNPLYAEFYEANKKEVDKKVKEFRSKTQPMIADFRGEDGVIDFSALREAEEKHNDEKFAIADMFDSYVEQNNLNADEQITNSVNRLASSMNAKVKVVSNISELPEGAAKRAIEKGRKVKGWYDTNTGEVVLYLPNADSMEDARKTVFHEIVAHKGLREMLGDDFSTFLQNVFLNSNKKVRSKIVALASANNWNIETATEEYLATLAENGFDSEAERSYFQRIKDTLIDLLRKAGIRLGFKLSDKELRYILWRSYQMQQNKGIVGEAENVAMQSVLKVGNYAPEGDVLFRDSTAAVQIRDDYERKVSGFLNNLDEAYHDYLRSVRIAQDLIVEKSGTKIQDYEDVYKNAMRKSSMDAVEVREFHEKMADPFLKHASKMIDGKIIDGRKMTSEHIDKYLHLLHAPERNEVFARRDARRIKEEEIQKLDKQKAAGLITPADYNTAKSEAEAKEQDNYKKFRENDYSGLTEMFGEGKTVQELEALAKEYTNKFEQIIGQEDIDILQNDIKQISHFTLEKTYESGIISRKTMEELETMFEHYVPLRGFKDDVASDVYEYVGSEANPGDKKVVKAAKGRKSTADSPIANLLVMGTNAIVSGNKNKLVKMSLLNLAENHPTDLLTVSSMWYEKQPDGTWEPKVADIPENATAKEVAQIVEAFEEDMKVKAKAGEAKRRTGKSDIPLRVLNKRQEMQHAVRVMRNGTEYVVYINGNPKLAQAVNGLLNIDSTDNPIWKTARALNGFFARLNTSWSPEFIARNLARDIVASSITAAVKEGPKYTAMFEKNLMNSLSPIGVKGVRQGKFTGMYNLYVRYKNGKLDMNNPRDRYFSEFIKNGGETGITQMLTIDSYKNKMKKMVDNNGFIKFENAAKAVSSSIVDGVDFLNKGVENACRFSAYMTSRQLGKSITESIYDAKEISVNFNRKGSGAMGNRLFVTNFMFFNAAMQGLFKQIDLFKKYPAKMSGLAFGLSSIAFLMSLICINAGDDGDDDEMPGYFDINPFTRRGNFMVPIGDGKFAKIPLAYEVAVWYGMGDILATMLYDEYNRENTVTEIGMQLASMLPLDVVEGKNIMDPERTFLEHIGKAFIPSYAKPFAEAWGYEQDFLGRPINNRTDFNKRKPEWMRAKKSTSKFFIGLSKGITEITGGSKYKKGSIDNVIINPGSMEHLTKNLSGGFGTFIINSSKTVQALMGEEDYKDAFNVPFARSFYMNLDNEYYRNRRINDRWYYYVAESESLDFNFKMTIADPEIPKEEKDALKESYRQNGELEIMKVTKAYSKADKKYTDRIREAEKSGDEELVDKLYEMQSELRRKAVNKIDSIVEDHK